MIVKSVFVSLVFIALLHAGESAAGEPEVVNVKVVCPDSIECDFSVTLRHADEGWDHYADRWEVIGPDGSVFGTRTLLHPHVREQPFTRSLSNVPVPPDIDRVHIRAHDSRHGYGSRETVVILPSR